MSTYSSLFLVFAAVRIARFVALSRSQTYLFGLNYYVLVITFLARIRLLSGKVSGSTSYVALVTREAPQPITLAIAKQGGASANSTALLVPTNDAVSAVLLLTSTSVLAL